MSLDALGLVSVGTFALTVLGFAAAFWLDGRIAPAKPMGDRPAES